MTEETDTKAQFAARLGVSRARVTQLSKQGLPVKQGRVPVKRAIEWLRAHGKLAAALDDQDQAAGDDAPAEATEAPARAAESSGQDPALDALAERLASGALLTTAEAERVKQNYLARLRQLDYERQAQRLCDVDTVAREVGDRLNRVRHRLLALPQSVPPRVMACTRHQDVQQVIFEEVRAALEDLSGGQEVADKAAEETG